MKMLVEHQTTTTIILLPFSRTAQVSQYQNVSILDVIGTKGDGDVGDNWRYIAKLQSNDGNKQITFYRTGAFPVAQPTVSRH